MRSHKLIPMGHNQCSRKLLPLVSLAYCSENFPFYWAGLPWDSLKSGGLNALCNGPCSLRDGLLAEVDMLRFEASGNVVAGRIIATQRAY